MNASRAALLVTCLLVLPPAHAAGASAREGDERPLITVTGQAELNVPPDEAVFDLEVSRVEKDLAAARRQVDDSVRQILSIARANGVAQDDVKTDDLQVISTDHCPFCMKEQKELGRGDFSKIPNGAPGVEHRMSLIYDGGVAGGRVSLNRFVELTSTAAAKMFGLFPRKGTIAVGSDADIVVFDPERVQTISAATHHMNVDYSAYEGREVQGVVETVLSRGSVVVEGGEFKGRAGAGQFLKRGTCVSM